MSKKSRKNKQPRGKPSGTDLESEIATAYEDVEYTSSTISTQIRTLAVSYAAIVWLVTVNEDNNRVIEKIDISVLHICGAWAIFTLVFDYLQYLFGWLSTKKVLSGLEEGIEADYSNCFNCLREFFFWAKQLSLLFATFYLFKALINAEIFSAASKS